MGHAFFPHTTHARKKMETNAAKRMERLKSSAALGGILFLIYGVYFFFQTLVGDIPQTYNGIYHSSSWGF